MPEHADSDRWPQELIARAESKARRPIADDAVHLEVPVVGTRHWLRTEDPHRHFRHAIVTPAVAADLHLHDDWLLDALHRVG